MIHYKAYFKSNIGNICPRFIISGLDFIRKDNFLDIDIFLDPDGD